MTSKKTLLTWLSALVVGAAPGSLTAQRNAPADPAAGIAAPAPTASDQENNSDQLVQMSAFEVTTTQGHGYVSNNAASAFKTDESLMNIPQADLVVTNDLIADLNYENMSDTLQYVGVYAPAQQEGALIRGMYVAEYVDDTPYNDTFDCLNFIDSYEIIKGPAETLYLDSSLGGVVLKTTKKPLPFNQDLLSFRIDEWGMYRFTGDFTGPLGHLGHAAVSYRLCTLYQNGHTYFTNLIDDRYDIIPEFQVNYYNTSVRAYYNLTHIYGEPNGMTLLTPNGNLYTGWGWKESNQPPDNAIRDEAKTLHVEVLQKISDRWEAKIIGHYWSDFISDPVVEPISVNWDNNTEQVSPFIYGETFHNWTVMGDIQGHYDIGRIPNRDAFGFGYSDWVETQDFAANAPFGTNGILTVPVDTPAAINSVVVPAMGEFADPNQFGARFEWNISAIYWQHTVDVVPDWLTLLAGYTWENIEETTVPDTAMAPWQSVSIPASQWLHRFGAVVHLGRDVSLYALDSTSFTPSGAEPLESGLAAPSQTGTGRELGVKWNFLGGKISGEAAWFKLTNTNNVNPYGGTFPNGVGYAVLIGTSAEEGVDGDAALTLLPGWQLIGSFYAGHNRNTNNQPITGSWDNSLALFTRYAFEKTGTLDGLAIGGGVSRIGGRWISNAGLTYSAYPVPADVKIQTGTLVDGFLAYDINKHWMLRVDVQNILNQAYPLNVEAIYFVDPSPPRTWSFSSTYKF